MGRNLMPTRQRGAGSTGWDFFYCVGSTRNQHPDRTGQPGLIAYTPRDSGQLTFTSEHRRFRHSDALASSRGKIK